MTEATAVGRAERDARRLERRRAALALRPSQTPRGPAPDRVRVATWNLNSLRVRLDAVERLLIRARPDVLCLQETRAPAPSDAARTMLLALGYQVAHAGNGSSNGVAIAARHPIRDVTASGAFHDEHLDRDARLVCGVVEAPVPLRVASVYVPHGRTIDHWHYTFKLDFLASLQRTAGRWLAQGPPVVVAGDFNVAPTDSDVFHPDAFRGSTHVTPAEREAFRGLLGLGLVDTDAALWGEHARRFTWWRYGIGYARNLGMRIDMILADPRLAPSLDATWIDHVERGTDPPSDHAALLADFHAARPSDPPDGG